jgi:hypothetical protein
MKKALCLIRPDVTYASGRTDYQWPETEDPSLSSIQVPFSSYKVLLNEDGNVEIAGPQLEMLRMILGEDDLVDKYLADPRVQRISIDDIEYFEPGGAYGWAPAGAKSPWCVKAERWKSFWDKNLKDIPT